MKGNEIPVNGRVVALCKPVSGEKSCGCWTIFSGVIYVLNERGTRIAVRNCPTCGEYTVPLEIKYG